MEAYLKKEKCIGRRPLLSLRARIFFPTRESTAESRTREPCSQQPLHAIAVGSADAAVLQILRKIQVANACRFCRGWWWRITCENVPRRVGGPECTIASRPPSEASRRSTSARSKEGTGDLHSPSRGTRSPQLIPTLLALGCPIVAWVVHGLGGSVLLGALQDFLRENLPQVALTCQLVGLATDQTRRGGAARRRDGPKTISKKSRLVVGQAARKNICRASSARLASTISFWVSCWVSIWA